MTREELVPVMKYLQTAYKGFYEGSDPSDVMTVWHDLLKDEDARVVRAATKNYVMSSPYPPTPSEILKQIGMIKDDGSDMESWAKLQRAISNSLYNAAEEFKKLPPECQAFVGGPSALRDLAQTEIGTVNTVVKGQFLKTIGTIRQRQEARNELSAEVRQAIEESKWKLLESENI